MFPPKYDVQSVLSAGLSGMENLQKLIVGDGLLDNPKIRGSKGANSVKYPTDKWQMQETSPRDMVGDETVKLRINNYDVPYGRIRSGIQSRNRLIKLDEEDSDNELEKNLAIMDRRNRITKPTKPKEEVMVELP